MRRTPPNKKGRKREKGDKEEGKGDGRGLRKEGGEERKWKGGMTSSRREGGVFL